MNKNITTIKLENWGLFFPRNDDPETKDASFKIRENVAKKFVEFLDDQTIDSLDFTEECSIGGKDTGDGAYKFSESLVSITRVVSISNSELLRAVDKSGNEFCFYANAHNGYMRLMFNDVRMKGGIDKTPFYYVPYAYKYNGHWA